MKIAIVCVVCKKEFVVLPCRKNTKCCSKECASIHQSNRQRKRDIIYCLNCNKEIGVIPFYKNKTKYCSKSCASSHLQRDGSWNKGVPQTLEVKQKISLGVKKQRPKDWINPSTRQEVKDKISKTMLERGTSKGKNNSCYGRVRTFEERKKQSIKMMNIKEENWMGFSEKCKRRANKLLLDEWRLFVFKRDNYTCKNPNCSFCHNKVGGKLEAHHIKPWRNYPELIYDKNNGITLCKKFHKRTIRKEHLYEQLLSRVLQCKT